jgi:hypothetical protein
MREPVRVGRIDELPPGRGRVVLVEGREVAVWNLEGRFRAAALPSPRRRGVEVDCGSGRLFDAFAEDSPARLEAASPLEVEVSGEDLLVRWPRTT